MALNPYVVVPLSPPLLSSLAPLELSLPVSVYFWRHNLAKRITSLPNAASVMRSSVDSFPYFLPVAI